MKVVLASDAHVDIGQQPSIQWPEGDVLVIAGDTANSIGDLVKFLTKTKKRAPYEHILFLDGNHEHYSNAPQGRTVAGTLTRIDELKPEGTTFLPAHDAVKIGHLYFVGRNGWYSFDSAGDPINNRIVWRNEMNDCKWIGFDKLLQTPPWELAELHAADIRRILSETLERDPEARFVVATHTAPHREMVSMDPRYLATNPFYINTHMQSVIADFAPHIVLWGHGHTHHRREKMIDGVYVVCNPRGYPSENPGWEPVVFDL